MLGGAVPGGPVQVSQSRVSQRQHDLTSSAVVQVSHILPDPMDSTSVASLLRFGRGIDRQIIGNFMGKGDSFNQEVMHEYVRTFPFGRMSFDAGFRAFADTFKQPPESQQVVRFTKNFVSAFLEAHGGDYRCAPGPRTPHRHSAFSPSSSADNLRCSTPRHKLPPTHC